MLAIRSEHLTLVFPWLLITFPECRFCLLYASDLTLALQPLGRLVFLLFSFSKQLFNIFTWHDVNLFSIHEGSESTQSQTVFYHRFLLSNELNKLYQFYLYNLLSASKHFRIIIEIFILSFQKNQIVHHNAFLKPFQYL